MTAYADRMGSFILGSVEDYGTETNSSSSMSAEDYFGSERSCSSLSRTKSFSGSVSRTDSFSASPCCSVSSGMSDRDTIDDLPYTSMLVPIHGESDAFAVHRDSTAKMEDGEEELLEGSAKAKSTSRSNVTQVGILCESGKKRRTKGRVSFNETVKVRKDYFDEDSESLTHTSEDVSLSKGDFSKPVYVAVELSEEERKIRSQLVGALPAERRLGHDFARMYGCGKTIRSASPSEPEETDDDIEAILAAKPVREIQAHAPSAFWFGGL